MARSFSSILNWAREWWQQGTQSAAVERCHVDILLLEDRIFYSASPLAMLGLQDVQELGDSTSGVLSLEIIPWTESVEAVGDGATSGVLEEPAGETQGNGGDVASVRRELAVIDRSLEDLQSLMQQLEQSVAPGVELEWVYLDATRDNVASVGDFLAEQGAGYDAIHLVVHGSSSGFQVGGEWVDTLMGVGGYGGFESWSLGLVPGGDLLLYGCSVAITESGQEWLVGLSQSMQVDVAASIDLTGSIALEGDWELEFATGAIETQALSVDSVHGGWEHVLATYTVTSTNDSGAGSLRQAIIDANNNAGADNIHFGIGSGSQVISLSSILPSITGQVTIDGWTQTGFSSTPLIIIDANGLVGDGLVLTSTADNSIIRGLVIRDFTGDGIQINSGSSGNTIAGNYIGSFGAGGTDLGAGERNTAVGINILGDNNTIGGTTAASRNVIGGNQSHGIRITGVGASSNVVLGNYIGTDATGLVDVGNSLNGIYIDSSATNNTIGGLTAASRNIISGNDNAGIAVDSAGTTGNQILGNYIGLGADGTTALGNTHNGVHFNASGANTLGSTDANGRNVISSNAIQGVGVDNATNVTILGNYIGVDATGTLARGNAGDGIRVSGTASGTMIGGIATGAGNVIANNAGDGILVSSSSATAASILQNLIYSNGEEGIDLGADNGLTVNDVLDADTGSNNFVNYPILRTATTSGTSSIITGNVRGLANTTFRVGFFRTPYGQADATGYGEARVFMGFTTVTTDSSGNASFSANLANTSMNTGDLITATATVDLGGGSFGASSEFAGNIVANESNLMISGSYTGNGIDNRTIAGLGFRPEVVIVMSSNGTAIRTSTLSGDATKIGTISGGVQTDVIQSLTGDGFTIGTSSYANSNSTTYHWVAFGAGDNLDVGAYTGNGTSQTISSVGFQAETVFTFAQFGYHTLFRTSQSSSTFDLSNSAPYTGGITSFGADSFSVGNSFSVNQSTIAFHYFAFNESASYFKTGTYTGNGADNRNITGVGFESEFVITKATSANNFAIGKTESTGYNVDANVAGATNQIQALQSDGFQVGTDPTVNQNTTSYMYMAWRQNDAPLIVDTTSNSSDGTTTSINNLRANRGADGRISLREAILATNATRNVNGIADQIIFQIQGSGTQTLTVTGTDVAAISDAVVLDATTQSGFSGTPLISIVDGDTRSNGLNLGAGSDGSTIRGFNIQGFGNTGISINSSNNTIVGNWIGTNASGTAAAGNFDGIGIWGGDSNTIGGLTAADRNVISGNTNNGISASGGADGAQIIGNYIGTDKDGLTLVANTAHGIWYGDSTGVTIGGNSSSRRNIIASDGFGIELSNTDNSTIQGNYVGLAVDGSTILGNDWAGIILSNGSSGNLIGIVPDGTPDPNERNVISGNFVGIILQGAGTSSNSIYGNFIGTDATGLLNRGNTTDGIRVESSASGNLIGGTVAGTGNTIAFNGRDGVRIESTAGTGNSILGNAIFSNTSLGINLVGGTENGFGVTANDSGDGDSGANGLQNMAVISSAGAGATSLRVQGSLNSIASRTFRIEVFASSVADASGHGEGQRYLGTFNVTTDGSGNIAFDQTLSNVTVAVGEQVTMTATDLTTNNTSEFAAAVAAVFVNTTPSALATNATRRGGLTLNTGSGNDSYLVADNGSAIFGGRTQFTIEMQFSLAAANMQHTFLSYAVPGVDNEVYLRTGTDGSLSLSVKGTSVSSSAVNFNTLVGSTNTLTVTWDNATGTWQFILNGTSFASGTGLQTGATLASGGSLMLGHDQDSVGGGFQSAQAFKGTFFDARIFSDIRTAAEITSGLQAALPYNTSGLLANWTFHDLSIAGEIMDTVSGNNLTALHASGVGFVADDPTLTLIVDENAANGTVVGGVYGTDADREARITALLNADSTLRYSAETGKFYQIVTTPVDWTTARDNALATALNGVNGQLVTIRSATENALVTSWWSLTGNDIWLGASDQSTEGTWAWQNGLSNGDTFWTGVASGYRVEDRYANWVPGQPDEANPPEDFARLTSNGQWRDIGGAATYAYVVEWNADDVLDATNAVTYSITSQTVSGAFAINSDTGVITVANGSLLNFETQPSHTVTVRVTDGSGATFDRAFTIALNNLSVEPTNSIPTSPSTNEDTALVFSAGNGNAIAVTDQNGATNSRMQVSLSVPTGTLTLSQTTGLTITGGSNGSGGMVIVGTESDINAALNGLTFTPVGNFNGNVNLVIETALAADMQGWYTFEGGSANDQSVGTTQNGTFVGNATTITDATRGTVLSLDGSGDAVTINSTFGNPSNVTIGGWVNLNVSNARAEFISLDNRIHIALDENNNGIKGSIQTGVGTWLDLTSQRFIAGTGWHHVMYVFDDSNNVHNLYIDGQLAATAASANSIYWTGATTSYIGQHPTTTTWNLNGKVDDVRIYSRALSAAEVAAIAAEQTIDSDTVTITVNAVNDAPVLDSSRTPVMSTILEDAAAPMGAVGTLVSSLVDFASPAGQVDNVTDIDSGANLGIAISSVNSTNGTWFYTTDNGTTWNAMGSVSQANARLLAADGNTRVYFQPAANYAGTVTDAITFFAWDRSSGTNGGVADLSDTTVADTFSTVSYSNDNGTANWSSAWVETDVDGGGASAGRILVRPTGDLQIRARATGNNIYREVNLSGASTASLSFNFVNTLTGGDTIVVQASNNGGGSYTTLGGGTFTSSLNPGTGTFNVDISSYIASNTRIRFFISSIGGEDSLYVDNVQITSASGNRGGTSAFSLASDTAAITVTAINDVPVIAGLDGDVRAYTEGDAAVLLGSSTGITDVDSTDFNTGTLTVSFVAGSDSTEDVLGIRNEGTGAGQIGVSGANVTFGGVTIGTWTGGSSGSNLVITFNANANATNTAALVNNLTYLNTDNDNPSTATRSIRVVLTDGDGGTSVNNDTTMTVAPVNDAPVLDAARSPALLSVNEHAGPPVGAVGTLVSSLVDFATPSGQVDNVTDVDSGATTGIAITATNAVNGTWWYSTDNGSNWQRIGNVSDAAARLLAADSNTRIYFEPTQSTEFSGTISNAITFRAWDQTSGTNGGTANATVNGGTSAFSSATDTAAITVNNVNDAPRILGEELITNGDFTTNLSGWTTSGSVAAASGRANFGLSNLVGPHSISQTISTVAGQTYQLSFDYLDGSSTLNQSLVASVTGSGNLLTTAHLVTDVATTAPGARYTFTFVADSSSATITLTDTSDQSGLSNGTVNVDGMVDNVSVRQLAGQQGTLNYTENAGAVAIHSTLNLSDFDSTNLVGATIQFVSGFNASQDLLAFTNQLGITGNYNSTTGVLTLSGTASVTDYQTALRSITYANNSESPTSSRSLSFTVDDGSLTSTVATRSIAISAVNDNPIAVADSATALEAGGTSNGTAGTNPTGNVLTNDTDVDAGDTKTVNGVAAGVQASAAGSVGSAVTGSFGSITIAADGSYTYTVDNNNASVQALRTTANTLTDVFTYTMADGGGLPSTTQITITIQGANDNPLGSNTTLTTLEDTPLSLAAANFGFTDIDSGDSLTAVRIDTLPTAGTLSLIGSGAVSAGQVISLADINAGNLVFTPTANANGNAHATIAFSVRDLNNAFDGTPNTITIDVTAVNDAPVLDNSGNMTLTTITEDQTSNNGNTVASIIASAGGDRITDVDASPVEGLAITSLTSGNGSWEYSLDGTNWSSVGVVSESSALLLRSTDRIRFVPNGQNSTTASFSFRAWDQTGASFGAEGTKVDVTSNGGSSPYSSASEIASITVTAVNDAPTITNAAVVNLPATNEDTPSASTSIASLLGSSGWGDVDTGAIQGVAVTGMTGNGSWQYSVNGGTSWTNFGPVSSSNSLLLADNAIVRYLPDGQNGETAEFTFRAWDQTVGSASGTNTPFYADSSTHGGTTTYSSQSATGRITVSGVNDAAIANPDTANASEAGGVNNATAGTNPTGNILANDVDVDAGDTLSVVGVAMGVQASASGNVGSSVAGTYGSIQIAANGTYTYTVDNNHAIVQALRTSGQSITDVFTYTLEDSSGAPASTQITITITGANDAPTAAADNVIAVEAGGVANGTAGTNPTGNALTNDLDVDSGDTKTVTGVVAGTAASAVGSVGVGVTGTYGSITLGSNGSYTYTVDNNNAAVQALRTSSDTLIDVFTYTMIDTAGATSTTQISVTIQGANDAPVASNDSANAIEAGGLNNGSAGSNGTGNVLTNDTDIDTGDTKSVTGVVAGSAANAVGSVGAGVTGSYGSIQIAADGSYTYTVDNNNAAVQALRTNAQTLSEIFTYTMQDAGGLSSTATLTITIQGSNDAPVAVGNTATALEASGVSNGVSGTDPTGNVLTNDTDVDAGDTKTVSGVAAGVQASASGSVGTTVAGNYGSIVINANGSYTYTVDNNHATVDALNNGQSITDTFTYTMTDAAGATSTATIVVTINGADDLPFAVVDQDTSEEAGGINNGTAGSTPTGNVFTNDITPNGNTLIGVVAGTAASAFGSVGSSVTGSYGSIVIDVNGVYTYTLNNALAVVEALRVSGDHLTDVFTYTFQDTLGYTSSTQVTITIDGKNDNPVGINDLAIAVEAGGVSNGTAGSNATGNVLTNDTDVDAGDTKHVIGVVSGGVASASGSVGASVTGSYGSVVVNADGTFSYTVNNSLAAVQALRTTSDTLTDIFTYTMEDTAGATTTATLTISIQGQNDNPIAVFDTVTAVEAGGVSNGTAGTNPSGNVLTNDTDVDAGDTKTVTGVVAGSAASAVGSVGSGVIGAYGSIQIAADGSYTYTVDNTNSTVQALRTSGQSVQDVFTYTVTDAAGATSTTQITVTIQGANDAPVVASDSATATEAGGTANGTAGSNPSGNVLANDSDVDAGDTMNVSGVAAGTHSSASGNVGAAVAGAYGSIQINSNGSYSYTVDNNNPTVQTLRLTTDTITDVFTYSVQDAAGVTSTTQITITIQGQNDAPVGISDNGDAYESGGTSNGTAGSHATGNVITNDIEFDSGDTTTVSGVQAGVQASTSGNVGTSVVGTYGSIVLQANGAYTYSIDESNTAVQALRLSSQTLTDIFSYTIVDNAGLSSTTQVTITVRGANDAPVGVADIGIAVEAGGLFNGTAGSDATGNVLANDTDVDAGDTKTVAGIMAGSSGSPNSNVGASVTGSYGAITIDANGAYTYTIDNNNAAVQALRLTGQTLQDVFTYKVIDNAGLESTTQVTITIQGQNDTPTAVADNTGVAIEAGGVSNGSAGSNATGNVLSNDTDVDSSGNGETKTVTGVLAGTQSSATGNVASSVTGTFGSITIGANGAYTYVVDENNAAVQALRTSGQTLQDVFTYTMTDAAGATSTTQVTITIQGANDAPVGVNDSGNAIEAGGISNGTAGSNGTGNVLTNDTDADSNANGETKTVSGVVAGPAASAIGSVGASVTGTYGSITIAADGSYTYVVDNSNATVQGLRTVSDSITDLFTYQVTDAAGLSSLATVTITITGQNDAPNASNDAAIAIEAGGLSNGIAGTNPTGNVLTNDTDVDSSANGETKAVNGVVAGPAASAVGSVGASVTGTYGAITIAADGSYTYTVDNSNAAVQALRLSSQTLTDLFTYEVVDAGGLTSLATITITIQGQNDTPTAVADNTGVALEAGGVSNGTSGSNGTGNVLSNDTDVDSVANGETKTVVGVVAGLAANAVGSVGTSVTGTYGSISIGTNGAYTYVVDNSNTAVQALRTSGQTLQDLFTYTMTDAAGETSTTQVTITIQGQNDNPVGVNDTADATEAGGVSNGIAGVNPSGNVLTNDTDVDSNANGETKSVQNVVSDNLGGTPTAAGSSVTGSYGSLILQSNGSYVYNVDNNNAAVQALRLYTDTLSESFTYTVIDAAGATSTATITITIHGADDTAVPTDDNGNAIERGGVSNGSAGSNATGNVLTNDSDPDAGDSQTVIGVDVGSQSSASGNVGATLTGTYGSITINADGTYTYVIDDNNATVQGLRMSGQTLSEVFTYTQQGSGGLQATSHLTITIHGQNDNPVGANDSATAIEAGGSSNGTAGSNPTGNVLTNDSDVDSPANGETKSVSGVVAGPAASAIGSVGTSVTGTYGAITIAADGSYTYAVDNSNAAVQALRLSSQTLTDLFTYEVVDAGGLTALATITITIQGQNDTPTAVTDNTGIAIEAGGVSNGTAGSNATGNVLSNDTDVDSIANGETQTVSGVVAGTAASAVGSVGTSVTGNYGAIVIGANGGYTYVVDENNASVQALRTSGQTLQDVFTYTITDAAGATSTTQVTITIQGANDAPVGVNDSGNAMEAGGYGNGTTGSNGTGNVLANDTDVDSVANGETKTVSGVVAGPAASAVGSVGTSVTGTYGSITIAANGSYTYLVDNTNTTVQGLRAVSDSITDLFTYQVTDAAGASSLATLTITITGQNDAPIDLTSGPLAINENAANGTAIGTVTPLDLDAGENFTYTLTTDAAGRFTIDANTGEIRVADGTLLNRENLASHLITVRVTDAAGLTYDENFTITINDVDEFDTGAVSDLNLSVNAVDENVAIGTVVGITANASDADATNNTITYSLVDNDGGNFAIDANTGVVTTAATINREALGASRSITVRATSADGSFTDQAFSIAINDLDEFNTGAVADSNPIVNAVNENVAIGTVVGITANAIDADATNSTITYSLVDNDGGNFAIDANAGVVTTAAAINREALGANRSITVRATSADGSFTDQAFSIAINDLDEFDTGAVTDSNPAVNAVNENVAIGTVVGIAASAIDADATNSTITYSLINNDGGNFAIDANTGVVTTAAAINREALGTSRSITVRATSADGSFTDQAFSIAINDLDEFNTGAVTDSNPTVNAVNENVAIGTVVGITANAIDTDATNSTITYSLVDNDGGNFAIDSNTGVVTTAAAINREALGASRSITVRATSTDGSFTDQAFSIAINDLDEFDTGAVTDSNPTINAVNENVAIGTVVGITANAIDADATNSTITYSLVDNDGGNFAIESTTGIVTTAALLDREALGASRSITVRATSADGSFADRVFAISVNDVDEFVTTPVVDLDLSANVVNENVPIGTTFGIVVNAFDADATNNTVTYSLLDDDGGNFAIDVNSGVVTTAALLDREALGPVRRITVRASSTDGSHSDQMFSISIQDVDEFDVGSLSDVDATSNSIVENASVGSPTGLQVFASDEDAANQIIRYVLLDDAGGRFAIDAQTGSIRVADSTRLNYEANSSHTILVQAISSDGSESQANFTIQVLDQQERPLAGNDVYGTTYIEDLVIPASGLLANDTDPDGGTLTVVLVSGPSTGSLTLNSDGSFIYEPAIGIDGVITFVYRVFDGVTYSDPATVQIVLAIPAVQAPENPTATTSSSSAGSSSISMDVETSSSVSESEPSFNSSAEPEATANGAAGADSPSPVQEASAPSSDSSSQQIPISYAPTTVDAPHANLIATTALEFSMYTLDGTHWYHLDSTHEGRRELESQRRYLESAANSLQFAEESLHAQDQGDLKIFGDFDQVVFQTVIGTGAVIWIAQGIQILATLLSVTPAWLHVDPLNIVAGKLDEEDAESERAECEKLFEK